MVEIIKQLKKILKGVSTLQGVIFNHHTRHEDGGGDEISVAGLSGELADQQKPKPHKASHQKGGADDLESLLKLANLAEKAHSSLTGVTASQHHTKTTSGEIKLADMLEKSHNSLTNVTPDQHHPQAHTLASHSTKAHSELTGVTASQHHTKTSKLSEITIDVSKNWAGKNITNFGAEGYNVENQLVHGIIFNLGTATTGTKLAQALIPGSYTIQKVILYADTAPSGSSIIVDINRNGSTIFTTQGNRPSIASGAHSGESGTPNVTSIAKGYRISVDVDQAPAGCGNDLLVTVIC